MLKVFTVFDSKVGAYLPPIIMRSAPEALRAIGVACADKEHDFHKFAEDYTIFEIAEWDEISGQLKPYPTAISLAKCIELSVAHSNHYFATKSKSAEVVKDGHYQV